MATATRISPGVYEVGGKRVNAVSSVEALKRAGVKQQPQQPGGKPNQQPQGVKPVTDPTVLGGVSGALNKGATEEAIGQLQTVQGGFKPQLPNQLSSADLMAQRNAATDAAYAQLSQGFDAQKQAEQTALEQKLYNKGIAYSPDPNSRYQQMMRDFNTNWNNKYLGAKNQSIQTGLNEFSTDVNANIDTSNAAFDQQQGAYNTNLVGLGQLSTLGLQGVQQYQNTLALNKDRKIKQQLANQAGRTSGGGGSGYTGDPAFTTGP